MTSNLGGASTARGQLRLLFDAQSAQLDLRIVARRRGRARFTAMLVAAVVAVLAAGGVSILAFRGTQPSTATQQAPSVTGETDFINSATASQLIPYPYDVKQCLTGNPTTRVVQLAGAGSVDIMEFLHVASASEPGVLCFNAGGRIWSAVLKPDAAITAAGLVAITTNTAGAISPWLICAVSDKVQGISIRTNAGFTATYNWATGDQIGHQKLFTIALKPGTTSVEIATRGDASAREPTTVHISTAGH